MPKFPNLADEDLHNIIAYLRSDAPELAPSDKAQPAPQPSFLVKFLCRVAFKPLPYPEAPIVAPSPTDEVAYGRYLATAKVACFECHSADFKTNNQLEPEKSVGFMAGGNPLRSTDGREIVPSANITMDPETGIGSWTEEQFVQAVRFAKHPDGRPLRDPMPPYTALTDDEARAIWAYLKTLDPVRNEVPRNRGEEM